MSYLRKNYQRLRHSKIGPIVSGPPRLAMALSYAAEPTKNCATWLVTSRESTNFTYDLTPESRTHLIWWVCAVTNQDFPTIEEYVAEIEGDSALAAHIAATTAATPSLNAVYDGKPRFGRRVAWYALLRALRPTHVVETGTDVGLGSLVLAAALLRNGTGDLTTIDVTDFSGALIAGEYAGVVRQVKGDSVEVLSNLDRDVDVFIHDSLHTYDHEVAELEAVAHHLATDGLLLSDNAHSTNACADFALKTGRRFLYVDENPAAHWYPGAGIGAAWRV
jgi:predicted O-methyltransferase YrrM